MGRGGIERKEYGDKFLEKYVIGPRCWEKNQGG